MRRETTLDKIDRLALAAVALVVVALTPAPATAAHSATPHAQNISQPQAR
jgi:hypothetical protein